LARTRHDSAGELPKLPDRGTEISCRGDPERARQLSGFADRGATVRGETEEGRRQSLARSPARKDGEEPLRPALERADDPTALPCEARHVSVRAPPGFRNAPPARDRVAFPAVSREDIARLAAPGPSSRRVDGLTRASCVSCRTRTVDAGSFACRARKGASAAEAAVFGLLGLLIAFTFSGAASRFEDRRHLITTEANAIGTAYLRIDLLPADTQPEIKDLLSSHIGGHGHAARADPKAMRPSWGL